MLSTDVITSGYQLVLGITPSPAQITLWQGIWGATSNVDFPTALARRVITHGLQVVTTSATVTLDQLQIKAAQYLIVPPPEQVIAAQADWGKPVVERITFNTDVMQARYGKEQRSALLTQPRVSLEFGFMVYKGKFRHFKNQINAMQGIFLDVPLWPLMQPVTLLSLNSTPNLQEGKYIIYLDYSHWEVINIVKVGDLFEFTTAPQMNVDRAWLIPLAQSSIRDKVQLAQINAEVATGTILANYLPFDLPKLSYTPSTTLNGVPVWEEFLTFSSPIGSDIVRPTQVVDFGTGVQMLYDLHGYSDTTRTVTIVGRRDIASVRDFFLYCKGRYTNFYAPTWQSDLELIPSSQNSASQLLVKDVNFVRWVYNRGLINYLYVTFKRGRAAICEVLPASNAADGIETIAISVVNNVPFNVNDINMVSFLTENRFASDTLEVSWVTPQYYNVTTSITSLSTLAGTNYAAI